MPSGTAPESNPNQPSPTDMPGGVGHMTPDQFRALGHRMVDLVASYWERLDPAPAAPGLDAPAPWPVRCNHQPGWLLDRLPQGAPEQPGGESEWDAIFGDVEKLVLPGLTHWQSPDFYAFFPCNGSYPAILGELLSAGLGVNGMLWATSPAATELETRVVDWMARAMQLPEHFLSTSANGGGCIQATASESTLAALLAARNRARKAAQDGTREPGEITGPLRARDARTHVAYVVYTSTQAHSSVAKAAMIAGLADGPEDPHIRLVPVDASGAMREDELARLMREDASAGRVPLLVCPTVGTTGITAIDRVDRIAAAIDRADLPSLGIAHRVWIHVDAAHAGALMLCPEFAHLRAGLERADSLCFNPHKWMLTTFDCDLFWTRDRRSLIESMSINPAYLKNEASDSGRVFDYRDWHVPLGRRFRAIKLWFVLRHYGLSGIRAYLMEHVRLAAMVEDWVRADERWELCAARTMNLVVFRPAPSAGETPESQDARTRRVMEALNAGGSMFVSPVVLPHEWADSTDETCRARAGRLAIRMCIGATLVRQDHVERAWARIQRVLDEA